MNKARRVRKRLRRQGLLGDIPREAAGRPEGEIPHYTVQAGLASARAEVKPEEKRD